MDQNFSNLVELKRSIEDEPAIPLEQAARICNMSPRSLRRHLHRFETRRGRNRHIFVTIRSLEQFVAQELYQPSRDFNLIRDKTAITQRSTESGSSGRS